MGWRLGEGHGRAVLHCNFNRRHPKCSSLAKNFVVVFQEHTERPLDFERSVSTWAGAGLGAADGC